MTVCSMHRNSCHKQHPCGPGRSLQDGILWTMKGGWPVAVNANHPNTGRCTTHGEYWLR